MKRLILAAAVALTPVASFAWDNTSTIAEIEAEIAQVDQVSLEITEGLVQDLEDSQAAQWADAVAAIHAAETARTAAAAALIQAEANKQTAVAEANALSNSFEGQADAIWDNLPILRASLTEELTTRIEYLTVVFQYFTDVVNYTARIYNDRVVDGLEAWNNGVQSQYIQDIFWQSYFQTEAIVDDINSIEAVDNGSVVAPTIVQVDVWRDQIQTALRDTVCPEGYGFCYGGGYSWQNVGVGIRPKPSDYGL